MTGAAPKTGAGGVLHVVTGLGDGGAEGMLYRVAVGTMRTGWPTAVVALGEGEPYAALLRERGIEVDVLNARSPGAAPRCAARLVAIARRRRPALVHGWMYHGNLAALVAGAAARAPVLWNVRQTLAAPESDRPGTELAIRVGARCSSRTRAIVYNARRAAVEHEAVGYDPARRVVVPNGFDLERFRPDAAARREVRVELGLREETPLSGCIARVHPVKDHTTLLAAFRSVRRERPDAVLILVGAGTERLASDASASFERGAVVGLGARRDVPRILAALDVAVLASRAEAFPNAVGEAMACGVPSVATDVGDVRSLLGDAGLLVPPGDDASLADAWIAALGADDGARREIGERARRRVAERFSLDAAVDAYHRLYSATVPPR